MAIKLPWWWTEEDGAAWIKDNSFRPELPELGSDTLSKRARHHVYYLLEPGQSRVVRRLCKELRHSLEEQSTSPTLTEQRKEQDMSAQKHWYTVAASNDEDDAPLLEPYHVISTSDDRAKRLVVADLVKKNPDIDLEATSISATRTFP